MIEETDVIIIVGILSSFDERLMSLALTLFSKNKHLN